METWQIGDHRLVAGLDVRPLPLTMQDDSLPIRIGGFVDWSHPVREQLAVGQELRVTRSNPDGKELCWWHGKVDAVDVVTGGVMVYSELEAGDPPVVPEDIELNHALYDQVATIDGDDE